MHWLEGKKTYIAAVVLIVAGAAGFWFGLLNPAEAAVVIGFGLAAIGLGDKADRYAQLIITALERAQEKKKDAPPAPGEEPPAK